MNALMISCFDKSTVMAKPWAEEGYLCYCVDLQHPRGETREGNIIKVGADMHTWIPPRGEIAFAAFFPPCTDLAVSGARCYRVISQAFCSLQVEFVLIMTLRIRISFRITAIRATLEGLPF